MSAAQLIASSRSLLDCSPNPCPAVKVETAGVGVPSIGVKISLKDNRSVAVNEQTSDKEERSFNWRHVEPVTSSGW